MEKMNFGTMSENEKIMCMIKMLNAGSKAGAVTMEQIIAKGIETGATEDYFRENWHGYKEGDHPWWQRMSPMVGVGTLEEVQKYNEPHLHRVQVKEIKESTGRVTNVMRYWYDPDTEHKNVIREKKNEFQPVEVSRRSYTYEEAEAKAAADPEKYVVINGKLYSRPFVEAHPEKFKGAEL